KRQLVGERRALLLGRLSRAAAVTRKQVIARGESRLEVRRPAAELVDGQLDVPSDEALRIGEARHAVRAHAVGEREQGVSRDRCGGGRRTRLRRPLTAAAAGGEHRERGGHTDDEWTAV